MKNPNEEQDAPSLDELYDAHGSHIIHTDGSITFLYRPSDPSIVQKVELDCPDLYEWMLNNSGDELTQFTKHNNMYSLHINNVPPDIFAAYRIKVSAPAPGSQVTIAPAPAHQELLTMHHLALHTNPVSTVQEETAYIQLGTAKVPQHLEPTAELEESEPPFKLQGSVTPETFTSSDQLERDTWIYKPKGFDDIQDPKDRKIIFMLDGKDFCEKLTPYIDAKGEPFSNTAILFIDPGKYQPPPPPDHMPPDRVREDYFETEQFSAMLGDELIPEYCRKLGVESKDNVILAAHSLAAYPMIDIAANHSNQIGGLFLFSPALNQKKPPNLPTHPTVELQKLPIFIQIGAKENATPPSIHQGPVHDNPKYKDMQNKSRLKATEDWHQTLAQRRYNVESPLRIHPYGHDSVHVFEGLVEGMKFHQSQSLTLNATISTDIGKTTHYKGKIKEMKQSQPGYMAPTESSKEKKREIFSPPPYKPWRP